jgi:hypothetical protein
MVVGVGKWALGIYGVGAQRLCVQEPYTVHEDWYTLSWHLWRVAQVYEPQPARGPPFLAGISSLYSVLPAHRVPPVAQRPPGSGYHSRTIRGLIWPSRWSRCTCPHNRTLELYTHNGTIPPPLEVRWGSNRWVHCICYGDKKASRMGSA